MNQKFIVAEMKVLPEIDVDFEIRRRVEFIKLVLRDAGLNHLILGISGGIDSCTCGRLAQLAVNELNEAGSWFLASRVRSRTVSGLPLMLPLNCPKSPAFGS